MGYLGWLALASLAVNGAARAAVPAADSSADQADGLRRISVDVAEPVGRLRSLQGVNGAPAPGVHKPENFRFGGWNMPAQIDVSAGYRMARIDLVRTHDAYGPGDIDARFETADAPGGGLISAQRDVLDIFPNSEADPEDPRSYNFGPTDQMIASIDRIGARVMFRLGRSEGADPRPPRDFRRYASIARHIVLHYNRGWAHGFHDRIRYWEIWNEPDLGKVFWSGTAQQYFDFYGRLARAVKTADPHALVGGPAIARPNDDTPYRDAFLEYVRQEHLPLDFYSWHWYATDSDDPLDFVRISHELRSRLDRHGFQRTASVLSEWNYGLMDPTPAPLQRATFIAAALIYMQDAPIDVAALYRADSVFGSDGVTPDKTGLALIATGLMKGTPVRLRTRGADLNGLAVESARSSNGRVVRVLLANYEIPAQFIGPRTADDVLHVPPLYNVRLLARRSITYRDNAGYDLTIEHLPADRQYRVERCRISSADDFRALPALTLSGGSVHLQEELSAPSIELVTVRVLENPGRSRGSPRAPPRNESELGDRCDATPKP